MKATLRRATRLTHGGTFRQTWAGPHGSPFRMSADASPSHSSPSSTGIGLGLMGPSGRPDPNLHTHVSSAYYGKRLGRNASIQFPRLVRPTALPWIQPSPILPIRGNPWPVGAGSRYPTAGRRQAAAATAPVPDRHTLRTRHPDLEVQPIGERECRAQRAALPRGRRAASSTRANRATSIASTAEGARSHSQRWAHQPAVGSADRVHPALDRPTGPPGTRSCARGRWSTRPR